MKFLLYIVAVFIFILVVVLGMGLYGEGNIIFDMVELGLKDYLLGFEFLLYLGLFIIFGVKLVVFFLYIWLLDVYGEVFVFVLMIFVGVLLKMGGYGLICFNLEMFFDVYVYFVFVLVILGVVNIVYGGLNFFG